MTGWILLAVWSLYLGFGILLATVVDPDSDRSMLRQLGSSIGWSLLWLPACVVVGLVTLVNDALDNRDTERKS